MEVYCLSAEVAEVTEAIHDSVGLQLTSSQESVTPHHLTNLRHTAMMTAQVRAMNRVGK